jgi:capsular polysaccharide biosynthesis protein
LLDLPHLHNPPGLAAALRRAVLRWVPSRFFPTIKSLQRRATLLGGGVLRTLPGTSTGFGPPRSFCRTLAEYASARRPPGEAAFLELHPAVLVSRQPPHSFDGTVHYGFVKEMSRVLPAAGIATISHGRVLTNTGQVIAPGDCLIGDVSEGSLGGDPRANQVFLRLKLPKVTRIEGTVAVLMTYYGHSYFHWIFDTLPRLRLLQDSGLSWDKIVVTRRTRFHRESLDLLGLSGDRVISDPRLHIEAATLAAPTFPGLSGNPPRWVCDFLRESFLNKLPERRAAQRKIYISRRKEGTRNIVDEGSLLEVLLRQGFEIVYPEEMSFLEQVSLFANARVIVSPHGAGLSNIVFCQEGTRVLEFFSPHYVNVCYWALANQLKLQYHYVLGEPTQNRFDPDIPLTRENIRLDLGKVESAVRVIC